MINGKSNTNTVSEVFQTLTEDQRMMVYYVIGHALDFGEHYFITHDMLDSPDKMAKRKIYNELNSLQQAMVTMLVADAIREFNDKRLIEGGIGNGQ